VVRVLADREAYGLEEVTVSNALGVHALVWTGGWSPDEAEFAISSTRDAGFDLLEIPMFDPSNFDAADTIARLDATGLSASFTLGLTFDNDINSEDVTSVTRGRDVLLEALAAVQPTGTSYLGGVIFGAMDKYPGPATQTGRRNSAAVIKELAQEAAKDDITIGLEFVNRYESNLLNTVEQTLAYMDIVDEPNVVVHADIYHMNIEENGFRTPILLAGDRLGYVHIGESNRGYLGTGTIDFDEFFGALADIDYSGPIVFESFSSAVVSRHLSNTLAVWRNLWTDGMDLAVSAREFISAGMEHARATRGSR
jgi:D-psicose/D-tagatose/L-ribulose 3-epimerase